MPGVTIVDTKEKAAEVVKMLQSPGIRERLEFTFLSTKGNDLTLILVRYHACDTEAAYFDIKKDSPYANGRIICASIFCGSDGTLPPLPHSPPL